MSSKDKGRSNFGTWLAIVLGGIAGIGFAVLVSYQMNTFYNVDSPQTSQMIVRNVETSGVDRVVFNEMPQVFTCHDVDECDLIEPGFVVEVTYGTIKGNQGGKSEDDLYITSMKILP